MNVTAIYGSPRRKGYTSRITDIIVEKVYLKKLNIKDCLGCLKCQETEKCIIRDDIEILEKSIDRSDLIIYSTPTRVVIFQIIISKIFMKFSLSHS